MPYCTKCESELKEDKKFCPNCGTTTSFATKEEIKRSKREMGKINGGSNEVASDSVFCLLD